MIKTRRFLKKISFIIIIIIIFSISSCTESNDEILDIETSLFYGKWYTRERCGNENYKVYEENRDFTHRTSLNENCNINKYDVLETYATYSLKGNEISYENKGTIKTIIEGTNDTSVSDEINFEFYIERIIELTEQQLTIEVESKISGKTNIKIINLYKKLK